MSKFLRTSWWRPAHSAKHKKLSEEVLHHNAQNAKKGGKQKALADDFGCDGYEEDEIVSFHVKYLGSTVVEKLANEKNISDHAVQCILAGLKAQKAQKVSKVDKAARNPHILEDASEEEMKKNVKIVKPRRRVDLTISPKGLCVMQSDHGDDLLKISIYRISNCRTHRQRIVSFLATDALETTECHAFLCKCRKTAEHVALAMARAFHTAYEQWSNVEPLHLETRIRATIMPPPVPSRSACNATNNLLITFDDESADQPREHAIDDESGNDVKHASFSANAWVSFEDTQTIDLLC